MGGHLNCGPLAKAAVSQGMRESATAALRRYWAVARRGRLGRKGQGRGDSLAEMPCKLTGWKDENPILPDVWAGWTGIGGLPGR